ncbi:MULTISPECIES: MarR family transcriptional regulator [Bacillaceae]|uniref:MarR family winged helix-turn-helix transcriptional regulator n=1 Tax=Bacillaceae TaxID=186817 RepID=UPI001E2FBE99|nr:MULTISPECIES: MarR family transcriptional regulator [Bacillaceae]MCE4047659.1 MarR family transcriptional regulator [Bacillus sp. Au-Bac7]MCM3031106.1 MarR family transcriptional regulator [Niallia sp. MER 6]MDL0434681.1 MarR family transcriptional regulator [Niallia sp. SS-2023]UPO86000.1 MarR family transcriptional regulator [Niallia sp. Man26]
MKEAPLGRLISVIHRQNQKYLLKAFKQYQIGNGGQYAFLKWIIQKPGINQDELTSKLKFDKATTARSVHQLEKAGYIIKETARKDRRANELYPTKKAIDVYPHIQFVLDQLNKELTKNLTDEERNQLMYLLKKIDNGL